MALAPCSEPPAGQRGDPLPPKSLWTRIGRNPPYRHQDSPTRALWQGRDPRQYLPRVLHSHAKPLSHGHSQPLPRPLLKAWTAPGSCSTRAARQGRCCCSQAWLCHTSLSPSQPGDGLCSPRRGSEQPGAPSSGQKPLGSTGAAAEQSLQRTRLIAAGDSSSGHSSSAALGIIPPSPHLRL